MCGIFTIINNKSTFNKELVKTSFDKVNNRGPEDSKLNYNSDSIIFGFKRLAINGLDEKSGQPMTIDNVTVLCNGEIYNFKTLYDFMDIEPTTGSDCEVIIRMYQKYGFEYTIKMLDGVFSIILYDTTNLSEKPKLFVARDPFGVRPLYVLEVNKNNNINSELTNLNYTHEKIFAFASEIKSLSPLLNDNELMFIKKDNDSYIKTNNTKIVNKQNFYIHPFEPGTYSYYTKTLLVNSEWTPEVINKKYFTIFTPSTCLSQYNSNKNIDYYEKIVYYLEEAVKKRVVGTTERPVACLLSGGLDSSLITALVNKYYPGTYKGPFTGFVNNIDNESILRNQFFALQNNEQSVYVPSSKSDMYEVNVVGSNIEQPHKDLFMEPNLASFNPNPNNEKVGFNLFNNYTRQQVKNV